MYPLGTSFPIRAIIHCRPDPSLLLRRSEVDHIRAAAWCTRWATSALRPLSRLPQPGTRSQQKAINDPSISCRRAAGWKTITNRWWRELDRHRVWRTKLFLVAEILASTASGALPSPAYGALRRYNGRMWARRIKCHRAEEWPSGARSVKLPIALAAVLKYSRSH